jgi:hypothetical protein
MADREEDRDERDHVMALGHVHSDDQPHDRSEV